MLRSTVAFFKFIPGISANSWLSCDKSATFFGEDAGEGLGDGAGEGLGEGLGDGLGDGPGVFLPGDTDKLELGEIFDMGPW